MKILFLRERQEQNDNNKKNPPNELENTLRGNHIREVNHCKAFLYIKAYKFSFFNFWIERKFMGGKDEARSESVV